MALVNATRRAAAFIQYQLNRRTVATQASGVQLNETATKLMNEIPVVVYAKSYCPCVVWHLPASKC
jgi:hypothetical protein